MVAKHAKVQLTPEIQEGLWSPEGPYSQARTEIETRILNDQISRTLYYVYVQINPTTVELLKKHKAQVKDKEILKLLEEARPAEAEGQGYVWWASERLEDQPELAEQAHIKAVELTIKLHNQVMSLLGLESKQPEAN